ncbi:hypothetical protein [Microbulbifer sp. JMSA008]
MAYLILGIFVVVVFAPLVIPWGKKLLAYCLAAWFFLWIMFFIQIERESDPIYDAGIVSDNVALGLSVLIFIIVIAIRSLLQFIWSKILAKRNHK